MPYRLENLPESQTDWAALRAMSDQEREAIAEPDNENPSWTKEAFEGAELVVPGEGRRIPISIRLSARVIEWFKRLGPGYQTRINQVLSGYVDEEIRKSELQIDWTPISEIQTEYRMKGTVWATTSVPPSPNQDRLRKRTPEYA